LLVLPDALIYEFGPVFYTYSASANYSVGSNVIYNGVRYTSLSSQSGNAPPGGTWALGTITIGNIPVVSRSEPSEFSRANLIPGNEYSLTLWAVSGLIAGQDVDLVSSYQFSSTKKTLTSFAAETI
jgi:hypothetical protein